MGNPKGSEFFSMSAERRPRKPITLTLPRGTLDRLERLAEMRGDKRVQKRTRSAIVEELIEAAYRDAVKRR